MPKDKATKEQINKFREHFQDNMLDGESVYNCSHSVILAEDAYEFFAQYLEQILNNKP